MEGGIIKKAKLKMLSLILIFIILFQILMPTILPLKSLASDNIEKSITTEFAGDIKLITSKKTSINANDQITVDVWVSGGDTQQGYSGIVGFEGYIVYDKDIFNEIDKSSITTPFAIDDSSGPDEDGYLISVRDGNNIGATNSIMFSITFVAKASAETTTVSINGAWLTVKGTPSETDCGPGESEDGYNISIDFPEEKATYTITYNDPSTEATNMPSVGTKREGESYTIASAPTRAGYRFTEWNTEPDGSGMPYSAGVAYNTDANLILYAQWEEIKGTLMVDPNGGVWEGKSTTQTIEQKEGTTKTINNPDSTRTPDGYRIQFNANGGQTSKLSETQTTTFDKWEFTGDGSFAGNTYTFGNGTGTLTAKYVGNSITLPTATRAGATMNGWYTEEVGGSKVGNAGDEWIPDEARTLFAHWDEIDYTLTINLNGGTVEGNTTVPSITGTYNKTVTLPTVTAPKGYTVTLNSNYAGATTSTIKQTQRLEKWTTTDGTEITGTTYKFSDKNDTITAQYVREPVTLETPTERTGYTFDGWYTAATGGTKVDNEYEPTSDIELFAHWTANTYIVTFYPGENATVDPGTKEVTYGETYGGTEGTLPVATKPGGKFLGWYNGETQITASSIVDITGSVTLTAKWEEVVYTLTVNLNGGTTEGNTTITGNYNQTVTLPTVTAPEGYTITLNSNYEGATTTTKKQTQRLEKWIREDGTDLTGTTYTFGEKNETITAQYVRETVPLEEPTERPGYTFDGWYTAATGGTKVDNEYEPTADIELFAHWTANKYIVTFNAGEGATLAENERTKEVTYGETYGGAEGTLPVPTKPGGKFLGWFKGETQITASSIVEITGPVTLTARWEGEVYSLTLNLNGGTVEGNITISPITGNYNETITIPKVTAPEGYTITLNNNYEGATTTTKKQTQRLEKWIREDGTDLTGTTYTFGEKNETITAQYVREPVTLEEPTERPGYTFDGWYTAATGGTKVDNEYEPTADIELFAHWTANKYIVTFNAGEGATLAENERTKEVTYGETYGGAEGTLPVPTKPGGKFLGWYNGETQITASSIVDITGSVTLTAKWEGVVYTLTVNLNGGTTEGNTTITGNYNQTVTLPEVTAPEGYTITLNSNYEGATTTTKKQTQRLEKWIREDGTDLTGTTYTFGEKNETITAQYVRETVPLEEPTERPGYTFDGWYTAATGGTKVDNEYEPTADIELFAHWTANKYIVTFNAGEGATLAENERTKEVTYGETYGGTEGTLPLPTKAGGKFLGWYNGETQITASSIVDITGPVTLTARWEGEVYTLTINLNGGKVGENTTIAPITGNYNQTVTLPEVTAPEGYTVTLNSNYGDNQTRTKKQTQRLEKWIREDGTDLTGTTYTFGEKNETITAQYVREAVQLEEPTERPGYTFDGWYIRRTIIEKVDNEYMPDGDVELFANWLANKYTITFDAGENINVTPGTKEVTYDEEYGTLPTPIKPGYEFDGWFNGNTEITADDIVKITQDTTLTAKWLGAEYTVTFNYGDGQQGTETTRKVRNGGEYGELPLASKVGHDFVGWFDNNGNKIESTTKVNLTADIILYARYSPKQFTIIFKNDDGSILEQKTANYGDTVTYTGETPQKENTPAGYTVVFSGWDNEAKLQNIKENVTLVATYTLTPITYTITYQNTKNADNSQNPVSYTVEDENIVLNDLANQGKFIFKGWFTESEDSDKAGTKVNNIDTSKAKDITLYAHWENDGLYLKSKYYKIGENNIDIYEPNDIYLDKIEPETTLTEFINKCETNGDITVIDQNGQELQEDDLVGTNMTIKVKRNDEEISLIAVVMGDLDGNGLVTPTDLSDVNKIVLKELKVEGAKFKAADIDDNEKITPSDLSDVNKAVLKIVKLTYTKK